MSNILKLCILAVILLLSNHLVQAQSVIPQWAKLELDFGSEQPYDNPLYDVEEFYATFTSPTGRELRVNGFWDGGTDWKVRFAPDEPGEWSYTTVCSEEDNTGLHNQSGTFRCMPNDNALALYQHGAVIHPPGVYHLAHHDGTPFFWTACTAWNGALKSTDEEWNKYLQHRVDHHYNVIQFVTTQWRGADQNSQGQVAYEGSGRITVNPAFFRAMDQKVDQINEYGLVAAPVVLWALPFGQGRHLSPGYHLPIQEAVLLAKYVVARYGGNQVVWLLGGDGQYYDELETRWKTIGREVFGNIHHAPVTLHPHGRSWIGELYADEAWMDVIGYQSSHNNGERVVNWINKGPMAQEWANIPPRPIINMEPNYEQIRFTITDQDVRNASYWSIFATPPAGITYGANGIWPWLREGESILNHTHKPGTSTWEESIDFPGSLQVGYLSAFMQQFRWWELKPDTTLLVAQPGKEKFNHFVSVVKSEDYTTVLAYLPVATTIRLRNPLNTAYEGRWFDPATNRYEEAQLTVNNGLVEATSKAAGDRVLVLIKKRLK